MVVRVTCVCPLQKQFVQYHLKMSKINDGENPSHVYVTVTFDTSFVAMYS